MAIKTIRHFVKQQDGAMTAFGLFLGLSSLVIGGLAIDVANAMMARTQLQAAADSAAHAALYVREFEDSATAKQAALDVAYVNMPAARFGSLLTEDDIQFGYWDRDANAFQIDPDSKGAVFVDISRLASKGNSVGTYFLRFAGFGSWDVRRGAVFEAYIPSCFREGFVAEDVVDMQSSNTFLNGFCIHSNTHVEVQNNNTFASNTVVSMPDKRDLVMPSGGFSTNLGLQDAPRDAYYRIRILDQVQDIIDDLYAGGATYAPDYITAPGVISVNTRTNLSMADFTTGRIHKVTCNGGQTLPFQSGATLTDIVLVTNCKVKFGANVVLDNVVLATSNTASNSVYGPSAVQVGRDDGCATNGGSQVLTMGGMKFAANLSMYGGQLIAQLDIDFSANGNGVEGASFIAGGRIDGTSSTNMGLCGSGMERTFEAEYFRLAS
jgi:hypothetical protein